MTDWRDSAECRRLNLPFTAIDEMFFPKLGGTAAAAAKRVCARCPVTTECLQWALARGTSLDGVWGATSKHDRRTILGDSEDGLTARATRYDDEDAAKAVRVYREIRPLYSSNTNAAIAVAKHLGIGSHKTVTRWIAEDDPQKATAGT